MKVLMIQARAAPPHPLIQAHHLRTHLHQTHHHQTPIQVQAPPVKTSKSVKRKLLRGAERGGEIRRSGMKVVKRSPQRLRGPSGAIGSEETKELRRKGSKINCKNIWLKRRNVGGRVANENV